MTGLNASAGISYCKFLAKLASDLNKPNGQAVITPKMGPDFVASLPVKKFHGVGPATAAKMERLGIETGADLRDKPLSFLQEHFGKAGGWYYRIARGIDNRPVQPDRPRKSVGAEDTFAADIFELGPAKEELVPLAAKVRRYCEDRKILGKTITLKSRFPDDHTQRDDSWSRAGREGTARYSGRADGGDVSHAEGHAPAGDHALVAADGIGQRRAAAFISAVSQEAISVQASS